MRTILALAFLFSAFFNDAITADKSVRQREDERREREWKKDWERRGEASRNRTRQMEEDENRKHKMAETARKSGIRKKVNENDLEEDKRTGSEEENSEGPVNTTERGTLKLVRIKIAQTAPKDDVRLMFKRSKDGEEFLVDTYGFTGELLRITYENLDKEQEFKDVKYALQKVKFSYRSFKPIASLKSAGPVVDARSFERSDRYAHAMEDAVKAIKQDAVSQCNKQDWRGDPIPLTGKNAPSCSMIYALGAEPFHAHCAGYYRCTPKLDSE